METQNIYLFGDQAGSWEDDLSQMMRGKRTDIVDCFQSRVFHRLRQEIGHLRHPHSQYFTRFSSLDELFSNYEEASPSNRHPALAGALCTLYHLSCFLRYDNNNSDHIVLATLLMTLAGTLVRLVVPIQQGTIVMSLAYARVP